MSLSLDLEHVKALEPYKAVMSEAPTSEIGDVMSRRHETDALFNKNMPAWPTTGDVELLTITTTRSRLKMALTFRSTDWSKETIQQHSHGSHYCICRGENTLLWALAIIVKSPKSTLRSRGFPSSPDPSAKLRKSRFYELQVDSR